MQRKVFRVEQMFASRRQPSLAPSSAGRDAGRRDGAADGIARELAAVQDIIARNRRDLAALIGDRSERRMARAGGELTAAVSGAEKAAQKILHEAEGIDECARALAAALKTDYERGLAHDIQDHTAQIYEACNFQDLVGQRIAKVVETLNLVEEQLAAMLARCDGRPAEAALPKPAARGLINGPKLDGDVGHADQRDIDAMFAKQA